LSNILPLQRTTTVNGHHNRNNSIQALKKVFALAYMKGKQELRRAEVGAAPAALKIIARQSWLTAGWPHDVPLPRPLCPCDRPQPLVHHHFPFAYTTNAGNENDGRRHCNLDLNKH